MFNLLPVLGILNQQENEEALSAMIGNLKQGGKVVIDFMNSKKVSCELIEEEIKQINT